MKPVNKRAAEVLPITIPVIDKATGKTTFILRHADPREFSSEVHGENFQSVASEFELTNADVITSRVDELVAHTSIPPASLAITTDTAGPVADNPDAGAIFGSEVGPVDVPLNI